MRPKKNTLPDDDPKSLAEEQAEAYERDARIEPQPVPPEKYPLNPTIDANPQGKRHAESVPERGERGTGGSLALVLLAIFGLAVLGFLAFDWGQPSTNTSMNQTTTESVPPNTVDQNQPADTQPQQPDGGTGSSSLPAQPVKPEQPSGGTTTTQP
jgi:hypothetical protein